MKDNSLGFTDEQLESLTRALTERLNSFSLFPHQRLGFPPFAQGKDVDLPKLSAEATLKNFKMEFKS